MYAPVIYTPVVPRAKMIIYFSAVIFFLRALSAASNYQIDYEPEEFISALNESIDNEDILALRYLSQDPDFNQYITTEHLLKLLDSYSETSTEILRLLNEKRCDVSVFEGVRSSLEEAVLNSIPYEYDKFTILWALRGDRDFNSKELFRIIYKIAAHDVPRYLDFIIGELPDYDVIELALEEVRKFAVKYNNSHVVEFVDDYNY